MVTKIRRQLTLFLSKGDSEVIEHIRQRFNPRQFELISAHVTLCREDEIENLDQILINLASLKEQAITIQFENPMRFDNGKGIYLKSNNIQDFNKLRQKILKGIINEPREQIPHITLMHPRNSTCNDEIFKLISEEIYPSKITFKEISLIENENDGKWKVLKNFSLAKR